MPSPDNLRRELDRWRRYCFNIKQPEEKNLIDILVLCDQDIFPNIRQLILIGTQLEHVKQKGHSLVYIMLKRTSGQ